MAVVLVVEDDPINVALAEAVLSRAGHQVLVASEGKTALDIARRQLPGLVLLDVSLAGSMTGLDVCRALRADQVTAGIPVLMLSAWASDSDARVGRAAGADGYLAKPFASAELRTWVQYLIDRETHRTTAESDVPTTPVGRAPGRIQDHLHPPAAQ